jgi:hypothetical protein
MESEVEAALSLMQESNQLPVADAVKELVTGAKGSRPQVPHLAAYEVDLGSYDQLLSEEVAS